VSLERAVRAKIAGQRNPEMNQEAQEGIEAVIAEKIPAGQLTWLIVVKKKTPPTREVLMYGPVRCKLINVLSPHAVPKVNSSGGQFKFMENINNFQKALKEYGVPDIDVFQTVDLYEKKDIANVTNTIFALGRATYRHADFKGPFLGPKPADECKRDFTDEQLKAGQTIVGLQAGSNNVAPLAGQNLGAVRKILLRKYLPEVGLDVSIHTLFYTYAK
ncbi:GM21458, partial [Drosophila sechellia]